MKVNEQDAPDIKKIVKAISLCTVAMVFPAAQWAFFGWLHLVLPLIAFMVLHTSGEYTGRRFLLTAAGISCIILAFMRAFDVLVFSLVLLLSGYVLFKSSKTGDSPALSGLKGSVTLSVGWALMLSLLTIGSDVSPFGQFSALLSQGVDEALAHYRNNASISADTLVMIETTLYQMKILVPLILPAILGSIVLTMIWSTMAVGNFLLYKSRSIVAWPPFRVWKAPDRLVWLFILAVAGVIFAEGTARIACANIMLLTGLIYSFQGFSITVFLMKKWKVPLFLRSFLYIMLIAQSFGIVILLIAGIADIWFDFRKLDQVSATE